jgi:hypothetical protein
MKSLLSGAILMSLAFCGTAFAVSEQLVDFEQLRVGLDTVWVLLAAFLVFFMQAGFGMVEAGFIRAKNTCNILTKNFLDFCMASLGFYLIGYALMFGDGNAFCGVKGWALFGLDPHRQRSTAACFLALPGGVLRCCGDDRGWWNG